jgi:cytochrome c oxidase cbb3-type subunit 3
VSEKKRDQVMGHGADNDGIEEYDNALPDWWLGLFFFTIVWAIGYFVDYHFIEGKSQASAYAAELEEAEHKYPHPTAAAAADLSPATIEEGREIFAQNCVACHAADMKGKIGPDLIDDQWIHGGTLTEIRTTITNGVPEKGMLTWGPILGPAKVAQVAAFVYSQGPQQGLEPPAAKAD